MAVDMTRPLAFAWGCFLALACLLAQINVPAHRQWSRGNSHDPHKLYDDGCVCLVALHALLPLSLSLSLSHTYAMPVRVACRDVPELKAQFATSFPSCATVESDPCACGDDASAGAIVQLPQFTFRTGVWWFTQGASKVRCLCSRMAMTAVIESWAWLAHIPYCMFLACPLQLLGSPCGDLRVDADVGLGVCVWVC